MIARAKAAQTDATASGLVLDIEIAPAARVAASMREVITSAIRSAAELAGPVQGTVTVLIDGDDSLRALNKQWRGIDKPTNVLSFPSPENQPGPVRYLGDIAISLDTAAREAEADGKPLAHHIAHLSVHGFLHLLGYDHESDADAEAMEALERIILARVDVPDPYYLRDSVRDADA